MGAFSFGKPDTAKEVDCREPGTKPIRFGAKDCILPPPDNFTGRVDSREIQRP